jgi:integrase/recombinase XerD
MAQAKTLTQAELDQVLRYASTKKYPERNRALILTSFLTGMRVAEIASLTMGNTLNQDGSIKSEIRLSAEQTKGGHPRTVFISTKLKTELESYLNTRHIKDPSIPLFHTGNRLGFTSNGLCVWFYWLYRDAGISGASSHSGRRSFATSIASKGVGIKVLQKLLGHKNIQTTSVYIYASDDMLRKAVELA